MQFFYGILGKKRAGKTLIAVLAVVLIMILVAGANARTKRSKDALQNVVAMSHYEKVVALTFDDGPGYKTTMKLLDGLKERGVRATFFLLGEKVEQRTEVVERMKEDGHLIGSHTYSHVQLDSVNLEYAIEEIEHANEVIAKITGEYPTYIRPPYGAWNAQIEERVDMTPVLWTVDPFDWNVKDVDRIVNYVVSEVKNGDIILMHDIYETSVVAALEIVDRLQKEGYIFVTVDDLVIE